MKIKNSPKLFGTDGIRGKAGEFPLNPLSVKSLGAALGQMFPGSRILIARDTRQSGVDLEQHLYAGLKPFGEVQSCGVLPTPGLAYLTRQHHYDFGIMITASHNPFEDNGIKFFNGDGEKIEDDLQNKLEEAFYSQTELPVENDPLPPKSFEFTGDYAAWLKDLLSPLQDSPLHVVLDCAHGATYQSVPQVFGQSGFRTHVINAAPNGTNINMNCGSTYLDPLKQQVRREGAQLGIAFDGDGDRVLFVDPEGNVLSGDHTLYLLSRYFQDQNVDFEPVVVATIMSNLGLELALNKLNIGLVRSGVGDKLVAMEMKKHNAWLGSEQSGHTILGQLHRTGDGILAGIFFLRALNHFQITPTQVVREMPLCPQEKRNIPVSQKPPLQDWEELQARIDAFEKEYGEDSRIIIRYSGTENKMRLMIESQRQEVIKSNIEIFENFIRTTIGE